MLSNEEIDKAEAMGATKARAEQRFQGATEPSAPLSGEWSGELTPTSLFRKIMGREAEWDGSDSDDIDELADAYEGGYYDAFTRTARAA